jgi:hypothetical protein
MDLREADGRHRSPIEATIPDLADHLGFVALDAARVEADLQRLVRAPPHFAIPRFEHLHPRGTRRSERGQGQGLDLGRLLLSDTQGCIRKEQEYTGDRPEGMCLGHHGRFFPRNLALLSETCVSFEISALCTLAPFQKQSGGRASVPAESRLRWPRQSILVASGLMRRS